MRIYLLLLLIINTGAWAAEIPLKTFAQPARYRLAALSPDGRHLALTHRYGKETVLLSYAIEDDGTMRHLRTITAGSVGTAIAGLAWVSPQELVVAPGASGGGLREVLPTGTLYAVNAVGGGARRLCCSDDLSATLISGRTGDPSKVLAVLRPSGKLISRGRGVFGTQDIRFALIDINSGEIRKLVDLPEDTGSVIALADGDRLAYLGYFQRIAQRWRLLRAVGAEWQAFEGGELDAYPIAADGKNLLMMGHGAEVATEGIFRVQLDTPSTPELLVGDPRWDVVNYFLSSDRRSLLAAQFNSAEPELRLAPGEHPEKQVLARLVRSIPGSTLWPHSWSADGQRLLVETYSGQSPGELYLYDRKADKLRYLTTRRPALKPEALLPRRAVNIPLPRGGEMPGFLTAPASPAPWPLVLSVNHSSAYRSFRGGFDLHSQVLANRGYAVLQINPPGSDGYGTAWEGATGGYGEPQWDEAPLTATDWARAQGFSGPQGVCLLGHDWAVYSLARLAARHPERFRCFSAWNGVFDPQAVMQSAFWKLSAQAASLAAKLIGGGTWPDTEALRGFRTPLLAQTGRGAVRAPADLMDDFCESLTERDLAPQCETISRESDVIEGEEAMVETWQRELDFFAQHLNAPAAAQ